MDDHMKIVAERNAGKSELEFRRHLARCGWTDKEITAMWTWAQRKENKKCQA